MSGTFSNVGSNFSFNTAQAKGAADPTDAQDLVTLNYADTHYAGTGDVNVATDTLWNAKGDLAVGTASDLATRLAVGTADGMVLTVGTAQPTGIYWATPQAAAPIGTPELVYRYTITGSDKASIDTGVDTADAGTNDWANGDLLEIYFYARCDEAVAQASYNLTFNNDGTSIYDFFRVIDTNATVTGGGSVAQAAVILQCPGASCAAGVFGATRLTIPNYAGTVGNKAGGGDFGVPDTTAANGRYLGIQFEYRSTTALSRLKVIPNTAAKKFLVGSQLLIYKRRNT